MTVGSAPIGRSLVHDGILASQSLVVVVFSRGLCAVHVRLEEPRVMMGLRQVGLWKWWA